MDRRTYETAWRRFDRRAVAPALMGATMMIPAGVEATTARAGRPSGGDEPERERRPGESALRGMRMYVKPNSDALRQAQAWRNSREDDAALLEYIASQPTGSWLGDWNSDVARDADRLLDDAARRGQVPLIVAYNIPNRDCGAYSAGGAGSAEGHREWIRDLARGIGDREAVVILEPDALGLVSCLTHEGRSERFSLIREAVSVLKARTDAFVYIDAGHAQWVDAEEMSQRLHLAGIDRADGFSLNVSNFISTERNLAYGEQVSRRLDGARFVIDTSRNGGNVASGEWCNPSGAALGAAPTPDTGHPLADAFLWVKPPGESDGTCNGGPAAGRWWADYALQMAQRSGVA
ncbi:MAG TPA: glycoside hydrolase family 6 protein [Longimicrobiales bacterium]|nr:glycoside hydrolase family 6 protein [Longimicrobiales bacterium]